MLSDEGLTAGYDSDKKQIAIDLNAVLHEATPLPHNMAIDFAQVQSATTSNHEGNLEITLSERGKAAPKGLDSTRLSDLKTVLGPKALQNVLRSSLGSDLLVDQVEVVDGKLQVQARAYSEDLKLLGEGVQLLSTLLGGGSVSNSGYMPLTLSLEPRGQRLYFSSSLAQDKVAEAVAKLGPKVEKDNSGQYFVDLASLLKAEEGTIQDLKLTPAGLEVESHLNLDHFLHSDS